MKYALPEHIIEINMATIDAKTIMGFIYEDKQLVVKFKGNSFMKVKCTQEDAESFRFRYYGVLEGMKQRLEPKKVSLMSRLGMKV